jgi:hypothetical protein
MSANLEKWFQLLTTRQQIFTAAEIRSVVKFLENVRIPSEGWGLYPGLPSNLHQSALAVKALSALGDPSTQGLIVDVAIYYKENNVKTVQQLPLGDLVDLLTVVRSELSPDWEYIGKILSVIKKYHKSILANDYIISVRDLGALLLSLQGLDERLAELTNSCAKKLISYQLPDGSWPASDGSPGCLITTAIALQAFTDLKIDYTKDPIERGLHYLIKSLKAEGDQSLDYTGDTFAKATLLSALAKIPGASYQLISELVNDLLKLLNEDGGWGGGPTEPSTVECTSLALLALTDAGENRYIPARLAEAALHDLSAEVYKVSKELDQLKQDFDGKMQQQIGNVIHERDKLRKENKEIKKEMHKLENIKNIVQKVEIADRLVNVLTPFEEDDFIKGRSTPPKLLKQLITTTIRDSWQNIIKLYILFTTLFILLNNIFPETGKNIFQFIGLKPYLSLIVVFIAITILYIFMTFFQKALKLPNELYENRLTLRLKSPIQLIEYSFFLMSREWPKGISEELVYLLNREFIELPPEIALRRVEILGNRLMLSTQQKAQLRRWLKTSMDLSVMDRRILFNKLLHMG